MKSIVIVAMIVATTILLASCCFEMAMAGMIVGTDATSTTAPDDDRQQQQQRSLTEWMGQYRNNIATGEYSRIIDGDTATRNRFPYFVALMDDRQRMVCGGSLIASNVVLTAAHCGMTNLKYAVLIGNGYPETIRITNQYPNPAFTLRERSQDQMLIALATPVRTTKQFVKVHLKNDDNDDTSSSDNHASTMLEEDDRVTVLGVGQTYTPTDPIITKPSSLDSTNLKQVEMGIVSNSKCQDMYDQYAYSIPSISDDMICLLEPSKGQCYGDSGGPYILMGATPGQDLQIGTVAWGLECASNDYPAVGIRTSHSQNDFVRNQTCAIALEAPSYFKCTAMTAATLAPTHAPPSNAPSDAPSDSPSTVFSDSPSQVISLAPTNTPSMAPSLQKDNNNNNSTSSECIEKPNRCNALLEEDICCGSAICQGGYCRSLPIGSTPKDEFKVKTHSRTGGGGVRGSASGTSTLTNGP